MRYSYRPAIPPQPQPYRTQIFDHLGLVAGMFEALGITEVIDQATQQNPEMRSVTAGHAVKAMVLNGLGFVNQQLSLVPHFFQHKPLARLIAPGIQASHLHDETLGRALDTLYDAGLTTLYSLIAATAARRFGKRGRPGPGAQPDQIVSSLTGALASRLTDRRARLDQQRCCILATNELDEEQ